MKFFYKKREKGFTLIELLVVVAIIGLLSTIVLSSLNSARTKAKYAAVKVQLNQFMKMVIIAQGESGKTLMQITGSGCSNCAGGCRDGYPNGPDFRNIPIDNSCYVQWVHDVTSIQNATNGIVSGVDNMLRDPWGSPYTVDENEGEGGSKDCTPDNVTTNGPDGIWGNGDDQWFWIPLSKIYDDTCCDRSKGPCSY